jgi:hypothetical protein
VLAFGDYAHLVSSFQKFIDVLNPKVTELLCLLSTEPVTQTIKDCFVYLATVFVQRICGMPAGLASPNAALKINRELQTVSAISFHAFTFFTDDPASFENGFIPIELPSGDLR